jgi:hypothetical protein
MVVWTLPLAVADRRRPGCRLDDLDPPEVGLFRIADGRAWPPETGALLFDRG